MNIQDSLDRQQNSYNLSGHYQNQNSKHAMQNLYKQQLDSLMQEKVKQKQAERQRDIAEKKQFNERALTNKQSERIKDQAYKNYYNMLLNNQEQLQSSYVSPYSMRDNMKDQHITHSVQEGQIKMKQWELEERKRQMDRKNMYRSQLMGQIEERKRLETMNKQQEQRKRQQFKKYGKLPDELNKYQRQKQVQEMTKYREDLDKFKTEKQKQRQRENPSSRGRTMSQQQNVRLAVQQHHALINPLPYNIQNPYILRQMNRQNYLANRGTQGLLG